MINVVLIATPISKDSSLVINVPPMSPSRNGLRLSATTIQEGVKTCNSFMGQRTDAAGGEAASDLNSSQCGEPGLTH
jgi:hypothetical protein